MTAHMDDAEDARHSARALGKLLHLFTAVAWRLHEHTPPQHCAAVVAAHAHPHLAVHDVWTAAHLLVINGHDHLLALAVAMQQSRVNTSAWTLGRAAQENAARADWLLNMNGDIRRNLARFYASVLGDLAQDVRVSQQRGAEEHKRALLLQERVVSQARACGFTIHKLSPRQKVDDDSVPDGQTLTCLGLEPGDEWAGYRLYSQSSSIAHGSSVGMMQLASEPSTESDRVLVRRWLKPEDAALIIRSCLLAHDLVQCLSISWRRC